MAEILASSSTVAFGKQKERQGVLWKNEFVLSVSRPMGKMPKNNNLTEELQEYDPWEKIKL